MADISAIRSGMAALLRGALPGAEGHVSPWLQDSPQVPSLSVAGIRELTYTDFGDPPGIDADFIVEAWLGSASDIGSQKWLDRFLSDGGISILESDDDGSGALYSRLVDGVVVTGQEAAAYSVAVISFEGQMRLARGTGEVLVAQWLVKVLA